MRTLRCGRSRYPSGNYSKLIMRKLRSSGVQDSLSSDATIVWYSGHCVVFAVSESRSRQFSSNGCFGRYHVDIFLDRNCGSRDRLVVRTLRCGRSNPGSNPGHGNIFSLLHSVYLEVFLN